MCTVVTMNMLWLLGKVDILFSYHLCRGLHQLQGVPAYVIQAYAVVKSFQGIYSASYSSQVQLPMLSSRLQGVKAYTRMHRIHMRAKAVTAMT
jgi:hypothetical protein